MNGVAPLGIVDLETGHNPVFFSKGIPGVMVVRLKVVGH
jgi:hypothetical protein